MVNIYPDARDPRHERNVADLRSNNYNNSTPIMRKSITGNVLQYIVHMRINLENI